MQFHRTQWFHPKLIFVHVSLFDAFFKEEVVLLRWLYRLIHLIVVVHPDGLSLLSSSSPMVPVSPNHCCKQPYVILLSVFLEVLGQMILLTIDFLLQLSLIFLRSFLVRMLSLVGCCQPLWSLMPWVPVCMHVNKYLSSTGKDNSKTYIFGSSHVSLSLWKFPGK